MMAGANERTGEYPDIRSSPQRAAPVVEPGAANDTSHARSGLVPDDGRLNSSARPRSVSQRATNPTAWAMPAGNRTSRSWTTPEAASIERSASVPSSWGARPNRLVPERQNGPSVLVTVPSRRGRPAWISGGSRLATNSPDCGTDARKSAKEVEQSTAAGGRGRYGRREGQPVAHAICSRGSPGDPGSTGKTRFGSQHCKGA